MDATYSDLRLPFAQSLLAPAHCCSTVNLHDRIYLVEGDTVTDRLLITARGGFH